MGIKEKLRLIPGIIKNFCIINGIIFAIVLPIVIFINLGLYVLRLTEFSFNISVISSIVITFVIFVISSIVFLKKELKNQNKIKKEK